MTFEGQDKRVNPNGRRASDQMHTMRHRVARHLVVNQAQLFAYILIVVVAIMGFFMMEQQSRLAQARNLESRRVLCDAILFQAQGQIVIVNGIVSLVENAGPRNNTPEAKAEFLRSKVLIENFRDNVLANRPTLDCNKVVEVHDLPNPLITISPK